MIDTNIEGWMNKTELDQLSLWAKEVAPNGVIVEVGSFKGLSASAWATADPTVKIYCIDHFQYMDEFINNTREFVNIIPLKGDSPNGIEYPGDPIDIFFLDAAHSNPSDLLNIDYFLPFIKPGGLLCGHDYADCRYPDVMTNVRTLEEKLGQKVTLYPRTSLYSFRI